MYNDALTPDALRSGSARTVPMHYVSSAIYRQKWLALSVLFFIVTATAVVTLLLPRQYTSQMKVLVKNARPNRVVSPDPSPVEASAADVSEAQINSEIELMNTTEILSRVVTKCNLTRFESAGDAGPDVLREKAVKSLARHLKIAPVRKANLIQIEYTSRDPRTSAEVLQQLSTLYLDAHLRLHGSPGTHEFFQAQTEKYRTELEDVEGRLLAFREENNLVATGQQRDLLTQKSSEAEASLLGIDAELSELQQKLGKTGQRMLGVLPRIVAQKRTLTNQFSSERLITMLAELRNRRTQLVTKFQPTDRLVQEVDQQIVDTSRALELSTNTNAEEQTSDINPIHQSLESEINNEEIDLAGLKARRVVLAQQVRDYRVKLSGLASATDTEETLTRARKEAESNYLLYARKQEEARVADLLDQQKIANVAIAEPASEPHIPSKPDVGLNLAMGLLLGVVISLGTAVATEYYTGGVYNSAELETYTGLPVLSFLPAE